MRAIKSQNTKPELAVRKLVYGLGYRYRLHRKGLPGKPDMVFGPRKKVIFVHGCFWHQHNVTDCVDGRRPKSNQSYWTAKLERNVERDSENVTALKSLGWNVLTIWECETRDMAHLEMKIRSFLGS